jgi:hypothetical protein
VGFRNSVSLPELVHQTRSAADSVSLAIRGWSAEPTLGGSTDGSSAFDVDPADLVFARARETYVRRIER